MDLLDFEIDCDKADDITVEDALKNEQFVNHINYLVEEGFIELEENENGEVRAYPVS